MLETFTYEEFTGYLRGNHLKYTRRAGLKAGTNDKNKAAQYYEWYMEMVTHKGITLNGKFYTKE